MHISILHALFIAIQALCVHALPRAQPDDDLELATFTPTDPISGWPEFTPWTSTTTVFNTWPHSPSSSTSSSTSYFTTTAAPVVTATTITVTDNSINWTPTVPISGWPPVSSKTQTIPGQQVTEIFTITYTSYSEETIALPSPSSVAPAFTIVTVTANPNSLVPSPTGQPSYTFVTVTETISNSATPRFTTITVSEVTLWPSSTQTSGTTQTSQASQTPQTSQLVTLTFSSSSFIESLSSTTVSYSSTVLTLSPPPTFATGTATVGFAGKRHL
ncbi:hypothetical protein F5Y08DRAFT_280546 [Xylaria arbuscula]|uniref:Uncharacterized protein n=1 Tax=Xylaria arbuscula TaxID=114810 RepID=A0A9W8N7M8_9PEZI|nr:hypothetical protein F5Y08DRAFT_280546 [Xylaria arbuscula]KAJ3561641.1 hypothetical protein NPX13_g8865 [Xylaria arbuscula]